MILQNILIIQNKYLLRVSGIAMTFRSLEMSHYQIIIPKDSVYLTINEIGYQNVLHLTDAADTSNRPFSQFLRRCEESLAKIDVICNALKKENIQFDEYEQSEPLFIERLKQNWKEEAKLLGIQSSKLIDVYEEKVLDQYKRFQQMIDRVDKFYQNRKQLLQKIACLEVLTQFFGDSKPKRDTQEYYVSNISQANQIQSVSFLVGVTSNEMEWKISKMVYRISRGYACTKTMDDFKFNGLKNFDKKVILVIYPSSDTQILEKRLKKVMQTFCENFFVVKQFEYTAKQEYEKSVQYYNEVASLVEMGDKEKKQFMQRMAKMSNIQAWRTFFWKEKYLFECMNKLDRREQFYIANVFIPTKQLKKVSLLINRIVPTPTMHEIPADFPPTAFDTNSYTVTAQQITDTYGVPRYQQVNPSIFTTVTFPFFFGVMFGDIAHGAMILALGIYLIMNNDMLSKGSFKLFSEMRYMITMMGFFATYCGFIYNDMAGFNMNFFTSCFNPPFHPGEKDNKISIPVHSLPGCVYPFGIDPVWGRAQNQLVFVNSLKMKISVIIAIVHMTLGVCIKASNSLFFKKKVDFFFQFIPQFIFLVGLFGYMDFLIIFKWLKFWDERVDQIAPQQWAPSIISTMMNIGLDLGRTSTKPDGNSNMWGERGNSSQDIIQAIILIVAFICIPVMLVPKPCIEIRKHKKVEKNKIYKKQSNPLAEEQQFAQQSRNALQQQLITKEGGQAEQQQHESSEIVVHQLIETIQFVLGTVSNTASYLRLWALSLAHSQLSKVFFQQTAGRFVGTDIWVQIISLFIGTWMVMWITFGIILCMDSMQCFLHSLRLHWVEFQNKFYKGDGYKYSPMSFKQNILTSKKSQAF